MTSVSQSGGRSPARKDGISILPGGLMGAHAPMLCSYGDRIGDNYGSSLAEVIVARLDAVLTSDGREGAQSKCVEGEVSDGGFQDAALNAMRPVAASPWSARTFLFDGLLEHFDIAVEWLGRVVRPPSDTGLNLDDWLQRAEGNAGMREQFDLFR
jgi:hypothetical protein